YRCAFGNAGNQAGFGLAEALKLGRDFLDGGRVGLAGVPAVVPSDLPAGFGKLLLLGIMLVSETLPRGGSITVAVSGEGRAAGFKLMAEGPQAIMGDECNAILS